MIQTSHNNEMSHQKESDEKSALIPDKLYFKIGEVCKIVDVKQHVLRYWESEFTRFIRPQRASSKQRLYRRVDVENILKIKKLLKDEGFTIPGAKQYLSRKKEKKAVQGQKSKNQRQTQSFFNNLKKELIDLKNMLEEK